MGDIRFLRIAGVFTAIVTILLLSVVVHAALTSAKFPIVATSDGMTITINDAAWTKNDNGRKGLLVHYTVVGDNTIPFIIAKQNTDCKFIGPNFNGRGQRSDSGGLFFPTVSPNQASAHLEFDATDPNASPEATTGTAQQTLTWHAVPVPQKRDVPELVGISQTTVRGTVVTLDKVAVLSPNPAGSGNVTTVLVFHVNPAPKIADMNATLMRGISLTTDTGESLSTENIQRGPFERQDIDAITGTEGYVSYVLPVAADDNCKSLDVGVSVFELANSLRDPRTFRQVALDIPLQGLPGTTGDGPEQAVSHVNVDSLEATLESMSYGNRQRLEAVIWIKVPADKPAYELTQCAVTTDTGFSLIDIFAGRLMPEAELWKANGAAPEIGEISYKLSSRPAGDIPTDAKSLTVTATAVSETQHTHRFKLSNIPVAAPDTNTQVNMTTSEIVDHSQTSSPVISPPAKMTITNVECVSNTGLGAGGAAVYHLNVHYRLDNLGYSPDTSFPRVTSIVDDQGRVITIKHAWGRGASGPFLIVGMPEADAKTLSMDVEVDDTVENAPTLKLVFTGVPIPTPPVAADSQLPNVPK